MNTRAVIVADLGFGDAGKGTMVDYLVRQARYSLVIRYNGGPQAAHNVITPDGRHHVFSQFGSGHFQLNSRTHLSKYMLINPYNLLAEAQNLERLGVQMIWDRLSIDGEAIVITPWHQAANQLREMSRGTGRHGSCGQGVGEARWDDIRFPSETLRPVDFYTPKLLEQKLRQIRDRKWEELKPLFEQLDLSPEVLRQRQLFLHKDLIAECVDFYSRFSYWVRIVPPDFLEREVRLYDQLVFEGAQGVLLDEKYGFHPYTTWSNTTFENALALLADSDFAGPVTKMGVIRGYAVRHGAGPFVTENQALGKRLKEMHNTTNAWQERFRVGYPDLLALRYAIEVCRGIDSLAVTHLDCVRWLDWRIARAYSLSTSAELPQFDYDERQRATRMSVVRDDNRQHMIELTKLLLSAKPVYKRLGRLDTGDYLEFLAQELGVQISHASVGPTANDKRELSPVST